MVELRAGPAGGSKDDPVLRPGPGEPAAVAWHIEQFDAFAQRLIGMAGEHPSRARVVAVDGRGGGGKSTLADRLHRVLPAAAVVHTDDVAWWHSRFGWADLMIDGILAPVHAGRDVRFRPPAWAPRGRTGSIDVPAGTSTLIIEGVGASRREVVDLIDVAVWVQSDFAEAERRGIERDMARDGMDHTTAHREWHAWADEEVPFLLDDRPWERADVIVAGTAPMAYDPHTEVATAPGASA
jgi:hypothetical protein